MPRWWQSRVRPLSGGHFDPSTYRGPDAAIAKPERRLFASTNLRWRAFHLDKNRLRGRDRLRRLRASGGALFAFSGNDEVCRDDRICRQSKCPKSGRERIP